MDQMGRGGDYWRENVNGSWELQGRNKLKKKVRKEMIKIWCEEKFIIANRKRRETYAYLGVKYSQRGGLGIRRRSKEKRHMFIMRKKKS